jgi:VIT1/CCC1 family predicted Fe2+/Mn2+ transporter
MNYFSIGFVDALTVGMSLGAGIYSGNSDKATILTSLVSEGIAGSISMGLSQYLSMEGNSDDMFAGFSTSIGFIIGTLVPYLAYKTQESPLLGFKNSIVYSIVSLIIFSLFRSYYLNIDFSKSLLKVLFIGGITLLSTFYITSSVSDASR